MTTLAFAWPFLVVLVTVFVAAALDESDAHAGDVPYERASRATFGPTNVTDDRLAPPAFGDAARPGLPTPLGEPGPATTWTTPQLYQAADTTHRN